MAITSVAPATTTTTSTAQKTLRLALPHREDPGGSAARDVATIFTEGISQVAGSGTEDAYPYPCTFRR